MYRGTSSVTEQLAAQGLGQAQGVQNLNPNQSPAAGGFNSVFPHQPMQLQPASPIMDISSKIDQMFGMMSATQNVMLSQQTATKKLQDEVRILTQELSDIKKSQSVGSASSTPKKRTTVPPALSGIIKKLHDKAEDDKMFKGSEKYDSEQNQEVADFFIQQIKAEHIDKYSVQVIKRAVYRYFESRRRLFNDSKPNRMDKVIGNRKKAQRKAFQKRLYERRKKHLKRSRDISRWEQIDENYMTEETESDTGGERVRRHKLSWRSNELNVLVSRLDERAERASVSSKGVIQAKPRIDSVISVLPPPVNAPVWAVDSFFIDDMPPQSRANSTPEVPTVESQVTPSGVITQQSSVRRRLNGRQVLDSLTQNNSSSYSESD